MVVWWCCAVAAAGGEECGERGGATADRQEAAPRDGAASLLGVAIGSRLLVVCLPPSTGSAAPGGSESADRDSHQGSGAADAGVDRLGAVRVGAGDRPLRLGRAGGGGLPAGRLRGDRAAPLYAGRAAADAGVAAPGRLAAQRLGRGGEPLLLRRPGPAAAGDHGHARVRRPARGRGPGLAPAARRPLGAAGGGGDRPALRRRRWRHRRGRRSAGLTAGFFWGAYILLSARVGALAPGPAGRRWRR